MSHEIVIEEHEMSPDMRRLFEQGRRNLRWLSENAKRLGVYDLHRGRHVAAAGGELFIADSLDEVERLARNKFPDEMPHVRYIPQEKRYRIYAG